MELKELYEKRAQGIAELRDLANTISHRGTAMTADETAKNQRIEADITDIMQRIRLEERARELEGQMGQYQRDNGSGKQQAETRTRDEIRSSAMRAWAASGTEVSGRVTDQMRADAAALGFRNNQIEIPLYNTREVRATQMSSQIGEAGGFTVKPGLPAAIEAALLAYGGMREFSEIIRTESGETIPFPTVNDTTNTGYWVGENQTISAATIPAFGNVNIGAYELTSGIIKVPYALLTDGYFDLESFIGAKGGERIGRAGNTAFTVGGGGNKATGILLDTTAGVTADSATVVTPDELRDMKYSLGRAYRQGAKWMMADASILALSKLKDGDGQYVWREGITENEPDMLLGHAIIPNDDMPAMTSGNKPILFGAPMKYKVREAGSIRVQRLVELYAAQGQVGFLMVMRVDGKLVDAGTHPVKHLVMA